MPEIPNLEIQLQDGSFSLRGVAAYRYAVVLAAGVAQQVTLPTDTASNKKPTYCFFAGEAPFFASYTPTGSGDVAAEIPAANITNGTAPDVSPTTRKVKNCDKIGLISRTDQVVTLSFYI
jgi:hypothetical protein